MDKDVEARALMYLVALICFTVSLSITLGAAWGFALFGLCFLSLGIYAKHHPIDTTKE